MKLSRSFLLPIVFPILFSCSGQDRTISIDCTQLTEHKSSLFETNNTDSLIAKYNHYNSALRADGISFQSDKIEYTIGEAITLTISNSSDSTIEYYFPNEHEGNKLQVIHELLDTNPDSLKSEFSKNTIAESPSFSGQLFRDSENFRSILLSANNQYICEILEQRPFLTPLKPGEEITFKVPFLEEPGYYNIQLIRHTQENNLLKLYGSNKFAYCNVFKVNALK